MLELVVDNQHVAPLELADSYNTRRRGLLGREGLDGAFWLRPCRHVHTFGMKMAIDVALVDRRGVVLHTQTMAPARLSAVRLACRSVVEAEAGSFAAWELRKGSVVKAHGG